MSWPGSGKKKAPPPETAQDPDSAGKSRFAAPPPCPRCELTKSQMNRTIQNYQKAYRKKVEGLKTELGTVRADAAHLRESVKRLSSRRLDLPSALIGGLLGYAIAQHLSGLLQRLRGVAEKAKKKVAKKGRAEGGSDDKDVDAAVENAEEATAAASADTDAGNGEEQTAAHAAAAVEDELKVVLKLADDAAETGAGGSSNS